MYIQDGQYIYSRITSTRLVTTPSTKKQAVVSGA